MQMSQQLRVAILPVVLGASLWGQEPAAKSAPIEELLAIASSTMPSATVEVFEHQSRDIKGGRRVVSRGNFRRPKRSTNPGYRLSIAQSKMSGSQVRSLLEKVSKQKDIGDITEVQLGASSELSGSWDQVSLFVSRPSSDHRGTPTQTAQKVGLLLEMSEALAAKNQIEQITHVDAVSSTIQWAMTTRAANGYSQLRRSLLDLPGCTAVTCSQARFAEGLRTFADCVATFDLDRGNSEPMEPLGELVAEVAKTMGIEKFVAVSTGSVASTADGSTRLSIPVRFTELTGFHLQDLGLFFKNLEQRSTSGAKVTKFDAGKRDPDQPFWRPHGFTFSAVTGKPEVSSLPALSKLPAFFEAMEEKGIIPQKLRASGSEVRMSLSGTKMASEIDISMELSHHGFEVSSLSTSESLIENTIRHTLRARYTGN